MSSTIACSKCGSDSVVKYGRIHAGKQRYRCHSCHRQFTPGATKKVISAKTVALVDKLRLERLSLAAIARVAGVSESWLQKYVDRKAAYTAEIMEVPPVKKSLRSCNATSCSRLWDRKLTQNGCGLRWMLKHEESLLFM